jgi:hypothetical protein
MFLSIYCVSLEPLTKNIDLNTVNSNAIKFSGWVIETAIVTKNDDLSIFGLQSRQPLQNELFAFVKLAIKYGNPEQVRLLINSEIPIDSVDE